MILVIKNNNKNIIFFVGTYSQSLWYADIAKLNNGTSEGIYQIAIPIAKNFKGIDPIYITVGSLAYDSKRHDIWISVMAYSKNGQILRYNLDTRTFNEFELPKEINSPLGMTVDPYSRDLWVTNPGTSIFYKFKLHELNDDNNNVRIVKFVTSEPHLGSLVILMSCPVQKIIVIILLISLNMLIPFHTGSKSLVGLCGLTNGKETKLPDLIFRIKH